MNQLEKILETNHITLDKGVRIQKKEIEFKERIEIKQEIEFNERIEFIPMKRTKIVLLLLLSFVVAFISLNVLNTVMFK